MIDLVYAVPLFLFTLLTTYTDIKKGVVKNKHLLFFLIVFAVLHLHEGTLLAQWQWLLQNLLLTTFFAVWLWMAGVMPAGDSKLLMVYSVAVPLTYYETTPSFFPMSLVLVIVFALPLLVSLMKALWQGQKIEADLPSSTYWTSMLAYSISFLAFKAFFTKPIAIIFIYIIIVRLLFAKQVWRSIALGAFGLSTYLYGQEFFIQGILISVAGVWLYGYGQSLLREAFVTTKKIDELKPGMVLCDVLVNDNGPKAVTHLRGEILYTCDAEGIEESDIKEFRHWGFTELRVLEELPLAPYIGLGVWIALLI